MMYLTMPCRYTQERRKNLEVDRLVAKRLATRTQRVEDNAFHVPGCLIQNLSETIHR